MMHIFDIPYIISTYGYLGIAIIVFLESGIFFALPADSLLFTAGLLAATMGFNIYFLILLIFVSTFFGGLAGYYIGLKLHKLHEFEFFRRILKKEHLMHTHNFFDNHGAYTIIISRFIPVVRTFTPIVAGVVKMHLNLFLKYSLIGSLIWSVSIPLAGYFLGAIFPGLKDYLFPVVILIILVSLLPVIFKFKKKRIRHKEPVKF